MERKTEAQWLLDHKHINSIMIHNRNAGLQKIYMFLDFDGVVNVFVTPDEEEYERIQNDGKFEFFSRPCIARLNRFAKDFPVSIVISSSWRFGGLDYCMEYLRQGGLAEHVVFSDTTSLEVDGPREELIMDYLLEHPDFTGFIIFDDILMTHLRDYLVHTNPMIGWDEERDQYARKIIQKFM